MGAGVTVMSFSSSMPSLVAVMERMSLACTPGLLEWQSRTFQAPGHDGRPYRSLCLAARPVSRRMDRLSCDPPGFDLRPAAARPDLRRERPGRAQALQPPA